MTAKIYNFHGTPCYCSNPNLLYCVDEVHSFTLFSLEYTTSSRCLRLRDNCTETMIKHIRIYKTDFHDCMSFRVYKRNA